MPIRTDRDDRYFTDQHQAMPRDGYTAMFGRMLRHPNITLRLGENWSAIRPDVTFRRLIWTGAIDEFFGFRYGRLPYRSLRFEHVTREQEWAQPVGVVNYPGGEPYTRVTEYKHLTGQNHARTSLTFEYPSAEGDPYYPVPCPQNQALYRRYAELADSTADVWFAGRLATYRYYNMDQVVAQALATFQRIDQRIPRRSCRSPATQRRGAPKATGQPLAVSSG